MAQVDPIYVQFSWASRNTCAGGPHIPGGRPAAGLRADPVGRDDVSPQRDGGHPRPRGRHHDRHDSRPRGLPEPGQTPAPRPVRQGALRHRPGQGAPGAAAGRARSPRALPGRHRRRDDTVTVQTVQVGERVGSLWVIDKGVKPGERIIVEGLEKVRAETRSRARAGRAGARRALAQVRARARSPRPARPRGTAPPPARRRS